MMFISRNMLDINKSLTQTKDITNMTETKLKIWRKALRRSHKIQFKDNNVNFFMGDERKKRKSKIIHNQYF